MKKFRKQVLRTGKWNHPSAPGGVLEITKTMLRDIKDNFEKYYPTVPVIRGHRDNEELEDRPELILNKNIENLEVDGDKLYATFEIPEGELDKYNDVSVNLQSNYEDHETGQFVGPIIRHVGMVVAPFIKNMESFVPLKDQQNRHIIYLSDIAMEEEKEVETKAEEEVTETVEAEVTEETTETSTTEEVVTESTEEVAETESTEAVETSDKPELTSEEIQIKLQELETLKREKVEMTQKIVLQEAEGKFTKLLSEGKITPAMKGSFIKLHALPAQTIDLADGKKESLNGLLDELFSAMPKLINLTEQGTNTETTSSASLSNPKFEAELKDNFLKTNPGKTDADFEKYKADNKEIIEKHAARYK